MNDKKTLLLASKTKSGADLKRIFLQKLMAWNRKSNTREMPWKNEKEPYKIWVSEIILQQTRVEQGLKYYENFIKAFATVDAIAKAPSQKVFKLWEGLGYYSRCRNLIESAKYISNHLDGVFPQDYLSILQLKGVGEYTASAIASFAYNLPHAVLDGNVFRVLSRIYNLEMPIDTMHGKRYFSELAHDILPKKRAGEYNQAIMDFGAVICKPHPECKVCFFNNQCLAYLEGKQDLLPIKRKKVAISERWLNYFIVRYKDQILIRKRVSKDIWLQLFEFVLIETEKYHKEEDLLHLFRKQYGFTKYRFRFLHCTKQRISHQLINFSFHEITMQRKETIAGFRWVKLHDLKKYAFPKSLQELVVNYDK
jgi:A/G-specific adenine glycosylase